MNLSYFLYHIVWLEGIKEFLRHLIFCLFFPISFALRLLHFRVIDHGCSIGSLCTQIDVCLKEMRLKRIPNYRLIIYPLIHPPFRFKPFRMNMINRYFCQLWKQHFFVVTNPFIAGLFKYVFLTPWLKLTRPYFSKFPNQSFYAVNKEYYTKYAQFSKESAILKIPEKDQVKGWEILKTLGVGEKDWFVTFYAREPGYYDDKDQSNQGVIRNVDVETYEKAMEEIIRRGGWCIRMGSSKMRPLPETLRHLPRVIDYPKTDAVSDFMDIFLAANCKFMLTCASGLSFLPGLFGVPVLSTNLITLNDGKPLHPQDISILKRFHSKKLKRELTFPEAFMSYATDHYLSYFFESLSLELIPNTKEEIYEATKEMLDRLDNTYQELSIYQTLQKKFDEAIPACLHCKDALGKVGDHFLKAHEHLL